MTATGARHDEDVPLVERVIETAVFAPLELAASAITVPPRTIARAVGKVRNDVAAARMIGKFVVDMGVRKLRAELAGSTPAGRAEPEAGTLGRMAPDRPVSEWDAVVTGEDVNEATASRPLPATVAPATDDLALADYDSLPASNVVGKLAGLTQHERDAIGRYEAAHRHRRTILGKLDQLKVDA